MLKEAELIKKVKRPNNPRKLELKANFTGVTLSFVLADDFFQGPNTSLPFLSV